jgi:lipopolysaccharide transport system ATP-binding protein
MIQVKNISKKFSLYNSPADRLKEIFLKKKFHEEYQVLKDINFSIDKGETLGIIGENGAGKTTLLKIVMGVLLPDSGQVIKEGKVTGLLALGTGFKHELTGRKNIYINGMLIGMDKEEIDSKVEEIIDFTELGDFIDEPLKIYSSGMLMRLAFSIAYHAEPECFIIDEALSVGDAHFQLKSKQKLTQYKEAGGSVIFVSHDMNAIKVLCDKALLLHKGEVVEYGEPSNIVNLYNMLISEKNKDKDYYKSFYSDNQRNFKHGSMEVEIVDIKLQGQISMNSYLTVGEKTIIQIKLKANENLDKISTGIFIRDRYGQNIFGTNLYFNDQLLSVIKDHFYLVEFSMNMNIGIGKYTVSAAVHHDPKGENRRLYWVDHFLNFQVDINKDDIFAGICKLYPEISIKEV